MNKNSNDETNKDKNNKNSKVKIMNENVDNNKVSGIVNKGSKN